MKNPLAIALAAGMLVFPMAALAQEPAAPADQAESKPPIPGAVKYKVETVCDGLTVPWSIVFDPAATAKDPRFFITERNGKVRLYAEGKLNPKPVYVVPDLTKLRGEIGLMGMCLHPDFAKNHSVYLAYGHGEEGEGGKAKNDIRVVRFTYKQGDASDPGSFEDPKVIISGLPAGGNHAGCRIKFGPDGKLYVTAGEMFQRQLAQDLSSLGGKILRLNDDGSVPSDNPFTGEQWKAKGARPEIWSLGNRNPQGIDWQPGTGVCFESEHGPSGEAGQGGDEVNIIEKGKNYGWPIIHNDMQPPADNPDLIVPLVEWTPSIAPASAAFYSADRFPSWKGNLLVGALGGLHPGPKGGIYRIVLDGRKVLAQERLVPNLGRVREVAVGPDGLIYFSTSNRDGRGRPDPHDDRIMRLVPDDM